eukprot:TRINITY_DN12028_c0_g1_i4.p1 TRINITY_DN12028_c0_g1~~TRINITY_DN12028_c0_g1_i4.p1  ORF type:complete len:152 (-),score=34.42 TRINITY_DN12028_c0_g1_i4:405-860(-)
MRQWFAQQLNRQERAVDPRPNAANAVTVAPERSNSFSAASMFRNSSAAEIPPGGSFLGGGSRESLDDAVCPQLTFRQRLTGFALCFGIGVMLDLCSVGRITAVLRGEMDHFAILYTLGNSVALAVAKDAVREALDCFCCLLGVNALDRDRC